MSISHRFQLTLDHDTYYIHTTRHQSVLKVAQDSETVGLYETRWLGETSHGGYWRHFKDQISSALLLNMDAIAQLIKHHGEQKLDTDLAALELKGRLRSLSH